MSIRFICSIVLFKAAGSLLILRLDELPIIDSGVKSIGE